MAISTNTFTINAGYAKSDLVLQMESALSWLGWHDKCDHTGIVTGIVNLGQYQADPLVNTGYYYDGRQYTSSGVGTDASFYMIRYGSPSTVYIGSPGYGYTNGEFLQFLPGEVTHGSGSLGWGCTVYAKTDVSYGTSTSTFYDKHLESGSTYNYGCLRHKIQDNKKYGVTYRVFRADSTTYMSYGSAPYFYPYLTPDTPHTGTSAPYVHTNQTSGPYIHPRLSGDYYLDCGGTSTTDSLCPLDNNWTSQGNSVRVSSSDAYQLDLNVYRSQIDPKFVVFSYKQPTLSSTDIIDNTFHTFILHNFTTDLWDLDHVWLGGMTRIYPEQTTEWYNPKLAFTTYCGGQNNPQATQRTGEYPFDKHNDGGCTTDYVSMVPSGAHANYIYDHDMRLYSRQGSYNNNQNTSGSVKYVDSAADYNAVIKGIPLSGVMLPCPKYIPDDFVIMDFDYATPNANIQQGDTITISGSEVYTVITGNYSRDTRTRGLLFCARTT
tara:strand:+ start:847 stop:2319 length:1473 start_codon:yes stop_codon:yes gene_type:complete